MNHVEFPGDNVDHEAHMRDVMADVADYKREIRDLRAELKQAHDEIARLSSSNELPKE
jgi:predicted RNase H-like nuclease (RuvC/YqgF family)